MTSGKKVSATIAGIFSMASVRIRGETDLPTLDMEMGLSKANESILLSFIIPVYNVEPYLKRCLDSVLCCNLEDCEIILSMGDSIDNSNSICETYAKTHSIIHALFQKGKGLSDARNSAMEIACGKYVLFLDSDDFVDSACLDGLINLLRQEAFSPDVIVTDFYRMDCRSGQVTEIFQIGVEICRGMSFLPQMLRKRQCFWNVWRYLYRRKFLLDHQIVFLENRLSEDVDYTTSVFLADPDIVFCHSPFYTYNVGRGDSLMDQLNLRRLTDTVFILSRSVQRLRESDFRYAPLMIAQFQFEYLLSLVSTIRLSADDRAAAIRLYKDWKAVLASSIDPIVQISNFALHVIGVRTACNILCGLRRVRRWIRHHLKERSRTV
ncbi:glycosyltransferase family 2 protein [Harryflintia acetispora]|uniref:glycosyltransferase family 2 protein n=1 Tax=Harryflintia acetispora TaxID=1849041 RepID=UPI00189820BD|nr:glycosyltransferase [Harryflintia acetispora]